MSNEKVDVPDGQLVSNPYKLDRAAALRSLAKAAKELATAIDASLRAADHRASLGIDCTRARMTTANAKWMRAAEDRDRKQVEFDAALSRIGGTDDRTP